MVSHFTSGTDFFRRKPASKTSSRPSGIGAVVNALRRTKQFGGNTMLVNPSPFAAKTFKMVGILSLFDVFASEEEAIAACAAG